MTDGPHLEFRETRPIRVDVPQDEPLCLDNFALWLEANPPTVGTIAGMLELLGNALYRQERFAEGSEVKHIVAELRNV